MSITSYVEVKPQNAQTAENMLKMSSNEIINKMVYVKLLQNKNVIKPK